MRVNLLNFFDLLKGCLFIQNCFKLIPCPSLMNDVTWQVKITHRLRLLMKTSVVCRSNDITGEYGDRVTVDRSL